METQCGHTGQERIYSALFGSTKETTAMLLFFFFNLELTLTWQKEKEILLSIFALVRVS